MIVDARHPWLARDRRRPRRTRCAARSSRRSSRRTRRTGASRDRSGCPPRGRRRRALRTVRDRARQLARRADVEPGLGPHDVDLTALGATLAPGFPDRIARRIGATRGGFVTADGQPLSIDRREAIHEAAGIVAVDIDARSKRVLCIEQPPSRRNSTTSSTPPQIWPARSTGFATNGGSPPPRAAATTAWARRTHCLRSATAPISRSSARPQPARSRRAPPVRGRRRHRATPHHLGRCSTRSRPLAGVVHGSQTRPRPCLRHAAHDPRRGRPSLASHPSSR